MLEHEDSDAGTADEPFDLDGPRVKDPRVVPVRFTALKQMHLSAAHYLHALLYGSDPTPAMKMGSAGHAATFEPHRLVVYPGKVRRGKEWDRFKAGQPEDAVIVSEREARIARSIADALHRHEDAQRILFGPGVLHEERLLWAHDGRVCTSIPDARKPGRWIADLKIVKTAQPDRFIWQATRSGHREQLRMYDEADAYVTGAEFGDPARIELWIFAVEPFPPFVVQSYRLHPSAVLAADKCLSLWWGRVRQCEETNHWPGYSQSPVPITDDNPENNPPGVDDDEGDTDDEELDPL